MVVRFSFGTSQFMVKMLVLEGRHGGLVITKALGEENGACLLYGYDYGFVIGFLCLLLQASGCCRRDSLRACCSDGDVSNVGVGGG